MNEPAAPEESHAPLTGMRIVAIEQFGAGPFGTLLLADLGAEVIKIEDPAAGGDVGRSVPPGASDGSSLYFEAFNRGKRSIALDLTSPAGREVFSRLVATADAVYNNLRGDLPDKLGLTYAALVQAEAGWASLTGEPIGPPARSGLPMADYSAGLVAACGLLAGIVDARRTGRGRDLDTSLFDTALAMLSYQATWWLSAEIETRRLPDSAHPSIVPFQFFATADGYIAVACAKEKFFQALSQAIDMPELATDTRFRTFAARHQHRDNLVQLLSRRFRERTTAFWLDRLHGRVPCAPVRDLPDALEMEGLRQRDMLASYEHSLLGTVNSVGLPLRVSAFSPRYRASPALGADTADLLAELNFDEVDMARLRDGGAFGQQ